MMDEADRLMIIGELARVDRDLFGKMFAESFKWNEQVEAILHDWEKKIMTEELKPMPRHRQTPNLG